MWNVPAKQGWEEKKKGGGSSAEETLCLWWGLAGFFRSALWCFARAQALQISYLLLRISSPETLVNSPMSSQDLPSSVFSIGNVVWPGILHPMAILLIINIPSLVILEKIFAHPCEVLACFCFLYHKQITSLLALSTWQLNSSSCCWYLSCILLSKLRQKWEGSLLLMVRSQKCTELLDL